MRAGLAFAVAGCFGQLKSLLEIDEIDPETCAAKIVEVAAKLFHPDLNRFLGQYEWPKTFGQNHTIFRVDIADR